MSLDKIRRAVEMTASCKRVEHSWKAPIDTAWVAELWCNEIGRTVLGYGPDAWTAVQAAHAECARYENNPDLPRPY